MNMTTLLMLVVFLTGHVVNGQSTNNYDDKEVDQNQNNIILSMLERQSRVLDEIVQKMNQQQVVIEKLRDALTVVDRKVHVSGQQLLHQSRGLDDLVHKINQQQLVIENISEKFKTVHAVNIFSNKRSNVDQRGNDVISQQLTAISQKVDSLTSASYAEHRWQLGVITAGWILVQQHYNGSNYFNRGWNDYKNGISEANGDFWLGNDRLHQLTSSSGRYKLRFDLQAKFNSQWYWAEYSTFSVDNESSFYILTVDGYSGMAGDSFSVHSASGFGTSDRNDVWGCAKGIRGNSGGFWYWNCAKSNINGSPLLHTYVGEATHEGFEWFGLPLRARQHRKLMTSRMWLIPL